MLSPDSPDRYDRILYAVGTAMASEGWDGPRLLETVADAVEKLLETEVAGVAASARTNASLYRSAEGTVTRVIELAERWQHDTCRDDALAELRAALLNEETP